MCLVYIMSGLQYFSNPTNVQCLGLGLVLLGFYFRKDIKLKISVTKREKKVKKLKN